MELLIIEKHDGYGSFPTFKKGVAVTGLKTYNSYPHWCSCVIDGFETFVADVYVAEGVLTQDYNPTELIAEKDETVTLLSIVFEWLYVKDSNGKEGWLPASKVVSISERSMPPA